MKRRQSKVDRIILSSRERAILRLIAEGYESEEIGDRLYISQEAIGETQMRIMRKLNSRSLTSVLDDALEKGFISLYEILEFRFSRRRLEANG